MGWRNFGFPWCFFYFWTGFSECLPDGLSQVFLVKWLVKAGGEPVFPENASCMSLRAVMATTGSCAWAGGFSARTFFNNSKPFMDGICMSVNNKSKRHCPTRWNTSSGVRQETISQSAFPVGFAATSLGSAAFGYGRRQSAIYGEDALRIQGWQGLLRQEPVFCG